MGSQPRRLSDSLSAVKEKGFEGDGFCWDVDGLTDLFGSSVCFSIEADLRRYPSANGLDTQSDSSNSFMKRSG